MNRSAISATVISPSRRVESATREVFRRRASASGDRAGPASRLDAVEQLARRERAVALEDAQPHRRRSRSARTGRAAGATGQDPLHLAEPVGHHLLDVGEHLAAVPTGPPRRYRMSSASGQGAAASTAPRVAGQAVAVRDPIARAVRRPCAPVWHDGRSMDGQDHRSRRGDQPSPAAPPDRRGDMR